MSELTREQAQANAVALRDGAPAVAVVLSILNGLRREAFEEWSALPLNAPVEAAMATKAKETVAREAIDRIQAAYDLGAVADQSEAREREGAKEASLMARQADELESEAARMAGAR